MRRAFQVIVLTPAGLTDASMAITAGRAGGLGVLDFEHTQDQRAALDAIAQLAKHTRSDFGIKLDGDAKDFLTEVTSDLADQLRVVILTSSHPEELREDVRALHQRNLTVLLEATCLEHAQIGEQVGVDGLIAKGHEAGGRVGEETTFVFLQRFLTQLSLPVWAQGGVGLHTAAACAAVGAAGVVLDTQLALTRESPLSEAVKARIAIMDGSETLCLGAQLGESYRVYFRLGSPAVEELRQVEKVLADDGRPQSEILAAWRQAIRRRVGWHSPDQNVLLLGQDAAFAAPLAQRFRTVGGVVEGIRHAIDAHCQAARRLRPLDEGSTLAQSHGTRYPIVQGPMTRVSDTAEFAARVAEGGALPFLALALMRGPEVKVLLEETQRRLGERPWGVGILGFVPLEFRQEQLDVIRASRPPFALIAGGRPDQARVLEQEGIPTYLHVPSPGLLRMFLQNGARRFVFEGRECGGHVGPRSSFVLWDQVIDVLLESLASDQRPGDYHVVFAAGIHDALSASMVAVMAAPLADRGARVGVLMGTAYLFTEEAVASGAIVKGFQEEALRCDRTVLLETGPGHSTRCVDTPYASAFEREKRRLSQLGLSAEENRLALEDLNLGRLRIASKGIARHDKFGHDPQAPKFVTLSEREQEAQGMYMIGQVAALRKEVCTIQALHYDVAVEGSRRLDALPESRGSGPSAGRTEQPADVAIVGMACVFPKAQDLQTYWGNILNKVDAITEVPKDRWDWNVYYDPDPKARDKVYSKWGGFIDYIPFDPTQYGMPPSTLPSIEPAQLLTLELVRAALKDAGYLERPFPRERTSVILGAGGGAADLGLAYGTRSFLPILDTLPGLSVTSRDIMSRLKGGLPEWTEDSFPGILANVTAGRVANRFDLGGANYTVDAACAASLAAVSLAVKELEAHTSDMVIVGGVDTMQSPFLYLCFSKTYALSPRGRCRTFDEGADGIVISEGIAIMVLKRLADAERDGDRIYAVIKGVGSSSDGRDKGLTAPRPEGQARALQRAYAKANISPATIGLIEAHGTGTVAGDQAEVQALTKVFAQAQARRQGCAIGSVKSMIGHTKCAAGVAGLTKAALALHYKVLPPTLGVEKPNSRARFAETPFFVNTEPRPWLSGVDGAPRRAGVSAFGFGGTNFHVVMEEYPYDSSSSTRSASQQWPSELFLWQGNSRQALREAVDALEKALARGAKPTLRDLAYTFRTLGEGQKDQLRLAVVAASPEDLKQKLVWAREALTSSGNPQFSDPRGIYFSERPLARQGKVAFLFPGQGSQYPNMLRDLAIEFGEARACFERADRILRRQLPQPLSAYIFPPSTFSQEEEHACQLALTQTNVAQPAIGAADLAMFRLLETLGVQPDFVAGHSYGEYVALSAAGVLSEDVLIRLSEARGRFIVEAAGAEPGTMAAVDAEAQAVLEALREVGGVNLANVNTPHQTVISGARPAVKQAVERLKVRGLRARLLPVACAFHSPIVAPAQERLAEFLSTVTLAEPQIAVYSNTTAAPYPKDPGAIAAQLVEHLVRPVEFVQEIEALYAAGARIFVEVGPRNVLTGLVDQILGDRPRLAVASDQSGRSGLVQLHHLLGQLAVHDVPVKLDRLDRGRSVERLDLNTLANETDRKPLTPTTWLVNGARAKPLKEASVPSSTDGQAAADSAPPSRPLATSPSTRTPGLALARPLREPSTPIASEGQGASAPPPPQPTRRSSPRTPGPAPAAPLIASVVPAGSSGDGVVQVITQFQQVMARFLDTQRTVMLAYLHGNSGPIALKPMAQPTLIPEAHHEPVPSQSLTLTPLDGPSTRGAEEPTTQEPSVSPSSQTSELPDKEQLTSRLLAIVSQRTGYPPDMLNLDLDLEADLGIDSIKRIEILGTFQESFLSAARVLPEDVMEKLVRVKTLRSIVEFIVDRVGATPDPEAPKAGLPEGVRREPPVREAVTEVPPEVDQDSQGDGGLQRYTLTLVDTPLKSRAAALAKDRVVLLTDDEGSVARILADELRGRGHIVALVRLGQGAQEVDQGRYAADLASPSAVAQLLDTVRHRQGPIGGVVHLLPLKGGATSGEMDFGRWRERLRVETKSLFYLAKELNANLEEAAHAGGACLVGATAMGGTFANGSPLGAPEFFPGHGGVLGLLKTLAQEWPEVRVKAVDLDPREPAAALAGHLLEEITAGDDHVEIGYCGSRRLTLLPIAAPLTEEGSTTLAMDSSWVVLVTGGGRGITAEVACRLAERYQPTLLLVGRSELPNPEESPETAGLTSPQALKAALRDRIQREDRVVTPAVVEQAYGRLCKDREMRTNLVAMKRAGAKVQYYQADVRDERALEGLIDEIYSSFGRLDGVIHGAGVIEDKLVKDKTPESFDRVFDTKVDSAFLLSRKLRSDSLKFLVFFSSVAGRFGNRGQGDYAAANEVLNKFAIYLDRSWPGRVVSVNWGPWATTGMVSPQLQEQFARRGVELIAPSLGRRQLDEELRYGAKGDAEVVIGGGGRKTPSSPRPAPQTRAFPIIGHAASCSRGPEGSVELVRELDGAYDLYLQDHRLDGQSVLPAAVATEFFAEVVSQGWPDLEVAALWDMQVLQGVVLRDGPKAIRVVGKPQIPRSRTSVKVEVEMVGVESPRRVHYRGTVELAERLPLQPSLQPSPLADERPFPMSVEEAYRRWLFHGPLFQGIRRIERIGANGISAQLAASSPGQCIAGAPEGRWLIDPVIVDSGFQLIVLWAREHWDMTPLPSRFRVYRRFGSPSSPQIRCEVRIRPNTGRHVIHADLFFLGADGRVLGVMEDAEGSCAKALNRLAGSDLQVSG